MGWYVLETNPLCEQAVEDRIIILGPKTFLPQMRRVVRCHKRGASPFQNIFPRYLFVELDLPADKALVGIVKRYPGVKTWLGASVTREMPLAVRDEDIVRLQELANDLSRETVLTNGRPAPLAPETVIRILFGPFDGLTAKVVIDNGIRADVLLLAAGVASKLSLPRELIEAVS